MRFCVDELSFQLQQEHAERLPRLAEDFIALIQQCREMGSGDIGVWSRLYTAEVLPGITLADLLFEQDHQQLLDKEVRQALMLALERCVNWDELHEQPEPPVIELEGLPVEAPTLAFAHACAAKRRAVAALGWCYSKPRGRQEVKRLGEPRPVHFVTCAPEMRAYLRDVPELEDMSPQQYMAHAPLAFPTICFAPGLANQFSKFARAYSAIRPDVTRHLAALEDRFQAILRKHKGETHKVAAEFSATCRVDASPESPNTHKNKAAMEQRRVTIDGWRVLCEWHTKLEPHRDRIYFHPGSSDVANGRLVVGIFHQHLPT
jgi:hypothetical protein